jgi:glycosyltransferase involved in cell wall biosynthesis
MNLSAKNNSPRLSIGLPVFNGENYLSEALDSLLSQTFLDLELIISDNASTDRTQEICQFFAAKDPRVRYSRNENNIGAVQNWYRTLDLSTGEYYASAAHDDLYHPEYMKKCIEILDQKPDVVLCYTKTKLIDKSGKFIGDFEVEINTTSPKPHVRLYNVIGIDYLCIQLYGVLRTSFFRQTRVYQGYYGCDRNTLAELSLLGQIYEINEFLFYHRLHDQTLGAAHNSGKSLQELLLLDPGTNWRSISPTFLRFLNYFKAVNRVPISRSEKWMSYFQLIRLIIDKVTTRINRIR